MHQFRTLAVAGLLTAACTPDIGSDPTPAVLEFDPSATPPRVSEPTFALLNRATGKIDLGLAGIDVPADCKNQAAMPEAQCEFNQYLESLDGFPTSAGARTPLSAVMDMETATVPQNVAVVDAGKQQPFTDVTVAFDGTTRYLQIAPKTAWPSGTFLWLGVRGYENGVRADGKPVVASVVYNLLKREKSAAAGATENELTCGATAPADIPETCPYLALLAQQMSAEAARASLARLEQLRQAMLTLRGWQLMEQVGGIPKAEAAMVWGFPIHSNPVIDLNPKAGLQPKIMAPDELRLAVNGDLDPATLTVGGVGQSGTVYLLNLTALSGGNLPGGFVRMTASFTGGNLVLKTMAPLEKGQTYGIILTRGAKNTAGKGLVPPPVSVFLMARGSLIDAGGKSTVSTLADIEAMLLEVGRRQLAALLDDRTFMTFTQIERANIGYLFAFEVP
jgi:hypothetical protein